MIQANLDFSHPEAPRRPKTYAERYAVQRAWILGRLQSGPVGTCELKREPRASGNPAQRVLELRAAGHDVRTLRVGPRAFVYALFIDGVMVEAKAA